MCETYVCMCFFFFFFLSFFSFLQRVFPLFFFVPETWLHVPTLCSCEELTNNKDLETPHPNHHKSFCYGEPYNPRFCTLNGRQIAVLSSSKVLLRSGNCRELATQFLYAFFDIVCMFACRIAFGRNLGTWFILHWYLEIYKFICNSRHVIRKAKWVLASHVGGEYKVSLSLFCAVHNNIIVWVPNSVVYIKWTTCLYLKTY